MVYVVNTMWGRMDQLLGNLCTMFTVKNIKTYLLSEDSLSFTLNKVCTLYFFVHLNILKGNDIHNNCVNNK